MPTALITGITGQDGSYLAELLLKKGYRVIGVARRSSTVTNERIEHLLDDITVVQGDLHDQGSLLSLLRNMNLQKSTTWLRNPLCLPPGTSRH